MRKFKPVGPESDARPVRPDARPRGTVLQYTCNVCGKTSLSKPWMWLHQYRQHDIESREEMEIIKQPMFQRTNQKERRAIEELIQRPKPGGNRECPACGERFWSFHAKEKHKCG